MPYYAVDSGNIFRCVEAPSPIDAAMKAALQTFEDRKDDPEAVLNPGACFLIHEAGAHERETVFVAAETVMALAGFVYGIRAEKTVSEPPQPTFT